MDTALRLRQAFQAGESQQAMLIAHSLKSCAGTIGAGALSAAATSLEQAILQKDKKRWPELTESFERELDLVLRGLDNYFR